MKTSLESSHFLYIISVGSDKVGFIWLRKMQFFHLLSMLYCVLYTYFLTSVKWDKKGKMGKWGRSKVLLFKCMYLSYKGYVDATLVDTRLIQQQNENVIWRRESAQKGLNSTSGTQFAALTLVNPVVRFTLAVVNWRLRSFAKSADSHIEWSFCLRWSLRTLWVFSVKGEAAPHRSWSWIVEYPIAFLPLKNHCEGQAWIFQVPVDPSPLRLFIRMRRYHPPRSSKFFITHKSLIK